MTIGIGVIGCGVRGQHSYELALARRADCAVRAVSQYPDITPAMLEGKDPTAHARDYARRLGADYHESHEQVAARDDVDIISLMCEPRAAPDLVEACCAGGKHIVRDKPMCLDLPGAERIIRAGEASAGELLITLGTRFSPPLETARERVASGGIGEVLAATFTYLQGGGPLEGFTASRGYLDAVGGGELSNFGHYAIDMLLWIVGDSVETVYATTGSHFYEDYRAVGMEDLGHVTMRFANGAVGTIITGRTRTRPAPESYFVLDVTGAAGCVTCRGPAEDVVLSRDAPESVAPSGGGVDAMIAAFVEAVKRGDPSPITARDGREVLKILNAAYRSAAEGKPARVADL